MQLPLQLDMSSRQSLQSQVFHQIRQLVLEGCLTPGTRLPASRALSSDLKVSRNTIVLAYEDLIAEGYLESRQPVGTFVSSQVFHDAALCPSQPNQTGQKANGTRHCHRLALRGEAHIVVAPHRSSLLYDFWAGRPDARLFPIKDWMRIMRSKLRDMQMGNSSYVEPAGLPALREAIVQHVGATRGIKTTPDQVIVVNGTQEGLTILSRMFVREGTPVFIEDPCYLGAANVFASHGARLLPIAVDYKGLMTDRLKDEAAFVYVTPSHQYPTGARLPPERRERLLDWAYQHAAYILEDDYNSDFSYDQAPLPALKSHDIHDHVIYLGTFSKSLGGGLRAGFIIVPDHLIDAARLAKSLLNNCSAWAVQALLAEYLNSGAYGHHLRRMRRVYAARRDRLVELLQTQIDDIEVYGEQCGMHLVCRLPARCPTAAAFEDRARQVSVGVYSLKNGNAKVFTESTNQRYARTLMLGYAALNEHEIAEGVHRLARLAS